MDKTQALAEANKMVDAARAAFYAAVKKSTRPDCPIASFRYEEWESAERIYDYIAAA